MSMEAAVMELLRNDAEVVGLVGDAIRYQKSAEGDGYPRIICRLISDVPENNLTGPLGIVEARLQIEAWTNASALAAKTLADKVRLALETYVGTVSGTRICWIRRQLTRDIPMVTKPGQNAPSVFGVTSDFFVQYEEAVE